jgi:hypothetical protein
VRIGEWDVEELVPFIGSEMPIDQREELHLLLADGGLSAAEAIIEHTASTGVEDECGAILQMMPNGIKTILRLRHRAMTALHPAFQ